MTKVIVKSLELAEWYYGVNLENKCYTGWIGAARWAQTIYIMESRSALNSTSPKLSRTIIRHSEKSSWQFFMMTENNVLQRVTWDSIRIFAMFQNLLSLLLSILEKMIPIDMAIKGSQCLWELNAFSIEMLDFSKICKCWIESKIPQIQIWHLTFVNTSDFRVKVSKKVLSQNLTPSLNFSPPVID